MLDPEAEAMIEEAKRQITARIETIKNLCKQAGIANQKELPWTAAALAILGHDAWHLIQRKMQQHFPEAVAELMKLKQRHFEN